MIAFGSSAWCAEAARLTTSLAPLGEPLDARLQFHAVDGAERRSWGQVIEGGAVRTWSPGTLDRVDLTVRWPAPLAVGAYSGTVSGTEALAGMTVAQAGPDGWYEGPAPPLNFMTRPEVDDFPVLAGATLVAQFELHAGPFGPVVYTLELTDGRLTTMRFGATERPDVVIGESYRHALRVRCEDIDLFQALRSVKLTGSDSALIMFAGIWDSPPYHRALHACGSVGMPLAVLGEVAAQPSYQEAMARLAVQTAWSC